MTAQHEEFGRERVEVALERHEPSTPQRCVQALVSEVERFADDAERSDDLTLLVLGRAERVL
jgi:serine phosphatase RsbU (regulator of sigma subunit)